MGDQRATMEAGLEVELKLGFDPASALVPMLAALPAPVRVIEQHNHYLSDLHGRLASTRTMLRIREERPLDGEPAGHVVVTTKRRQSVAAGVFRSDEREQRLARAVWELARSNGGELSGLDAAAGPVFDWLRAEAFIGFSLIGTMVNQRHIIDLDGFVLEVDQTTFPDGSVDAEIEVETLEPERARSLVIAAAAAAGVTLFEQTQSKYARFLARAGVVSPSGF